jgi:hypothetical protein
MTLARDGNGTIRIIAGSSSTSFYSYAASSPYPVSPTGVSYQNRPAAAATTWGNNHIVYKDGVGGSATVYNGTFGTGNLGIGNTNTGSYHWDGTIREVKIFDSELTAEEVGDL